jgi:hypothetical protein
MTEAMTAFLQFEASKKEWGRVVPFPTHKTKTRLLGLQEILSISPLQYLIPGYLPQTGVAVVFGPSTVGKSFICLDLAMRIGRGDEWRGLQVLGGSVVYVAGEGKSGFGQRVKAWLNKNANPDAEPVAEIYLLAEPIDFIADAELENDIRQLSNKPRLIVLDTLSQTLNGDDSSNRDVSTYVRHANILAAEFSCLVLIVHHSNKADASDARGAGAIKGNIDAMFNVREGVMECKKMKDGKEPADLSFKIVPVQDSCIVEWGAELPKPQLNRPKPRGTAQTLIFEIVGSKCQQSSIQKNNKPVVHVDEVAEAFQLVRVGKPGARSYFSRAFESMIETNLLHADADGFVSVP